MNVERFTELASKMLAVPDIEKRYMAVFNLQDGLRENIGNLFEDCKELIDENNTLRFGSFMQEVALGFGRDNIPKKCIHLLTYHLDNMKEYETDTEEKREERMRKLREYNGVLGISPKVKEIVNGIATVIERDPDLIYCEHGSYRQYTELCNTFYYRLCRKIQKYNVLKESELREMLRKICLYIALKNEKAMMVEEMALQGIDVKWKRRLKREKKHCWEQSRSYLDCLLNDADGSRLRALHRVLDGKHGKQVALLTKAAVQLGWITKPTYEQVKAEFGDISVKSGFYRYFNTNVGGSGCITKDEMDGAMNSLKRALSS